MAARSVALVVMIAVVAGCTLQDRMAYSNRYWSEAVVFEVSAARAIQAELPDSGRLFVILRPLDTGENEDVADDVGSPDLVFAVELEDWDWRYRATVGDDAMGFPVVSPAEIEHGRYLVQPVFIVDQVFSHFNAAGSFFGPRVELDLTTGWGRPVHQLQLDDRVEAEAPADDDDLVQLVRVPSELLSELRQRPSDLEAAVILPRGYDGEPERSYPVRYHIGPHGSRARAALDLMAEGAAFREMWLADATPRMILVFLGGATRYVDSDVNGPVGTATVTELIPFIESHFRAIRGSEARFLDGASASGGWNALALQVFFPEVFNGVWASCADSVDFRALGLIDIYDDANAYVNEWNVMRPSSRQADGEPMSTVSMALWKEQVLGRDGSFQRSGGVWAARHAAFSPHGEHDLPQPLWDVETGEIDREVAEAWRRYDLRSVIEQRWPEIGPHLSGKLRLWMGDMNSSYNNRAMHLLAESLSALDEPPADARIVFGPGQSHCWDPITEVELMQEMLARLR